MNSEFLDEVLDKRLLKYSQSFTGKIFSDESGEEDDLMLAFGLTQAIKAANKQYWGRELGLCWQLLVTDLFRETCSSFQGPLRIDDDEPCDLRCGSDAIDTKYRIGSGDSGTLKKFRNNAGLLKDRGHKPVLHILRNDNLHNAITACIKGGWEVFIGENCYKYIIQSTGFDMESWLKSRKNLYIPNSKS